MNARIGTDEAGKGDFFGYLTVAAVYVDEETESMLTAAGVKDSKLLSDAQVMRLERLVKKTCPFDVVRISPERYNRLYAKLKNLNTLLGWAHARAIENLLQNVGCKTVIADQFGNKRILEESLMKKGRTVHLVQKTHAESDVAVAAASILARAEFLRTLDALSKSCRIKLPKGAAHVVETARNIARTRGREFLNAVAKTHFKTMKKL